MAAVDPSESPERQKPPAEEVHTSGRRSEAEDEASPGKPAPSPDCEPGAGNDRGSGGASHSEVSPESGTGAQQTTCAPREDRAATEAPAEAPGGEQRGFEWSEPEEEEEEEASTLEEKCDQSKPVQSAEEEQQEPHVEENVTANAEEIKDQGESHTKEVEMGMEKPKVEEAVQKVGSTPAVEESVESTDTTDKIEKFRFVCKECGMRFTRRETFYLHRHFHAHEDDLTTLTCKECGLTFQHRSSLIKHRKEHKVKEEKLVTPKKEVHVEEEQGSFECAGCRKIFSKVRELRDHNCCSTVEKPFHCPLCRQEFQFKVSVSKHMITHSQERVFTCQECSQTFPNAIALRYHERCHPALKPYECPECGMAFKHYSVMEDHRRKHMDNTRSHLCNICGKTFKYSSLLHQHQYLHTGQKPFRCPECGKKFAFAQNMKAHCRQHRRHETKPFAESDKPAPVSTQEAVRVVEKENAQHSEEPKRTFNCPLCPQTYSVPANLRAHMLIHEAEYETLERTPRPSSDNNELWEKAYTCPHCPTVYRDESSLNVHLSSVHKSVAQYLQKAAPPPNNKLFIPLSSDNVPGKWKGEGVSIKSYKCSECGKMFRHRSVLELHMRIHSKDKPYQCKVCGKGFRFSSYLQQHLIIHTGKKPYKCPDCGKDFAFLQNMKTHQKLHQEKPFRCTSCRKGYSDEAQLQNHMLSHNGDKPHKCDLCDKSFGLAYLLRDHMNTHTGERPHRCDECHKTFSWFSSLLVHQKIHARKRQGFGQYNSVPMGTRMRGRGSRGRRGGRLIYSWSRPLGGSGMVGSHASSYAVSALNDAELHRRAVQQTQSSMLSSCMDLQGRQQKEPWMSDLHTQPVQWKVDGGEVMPVPTSQQQNTAPQQFDSPLHGGLQQHHQRSPGWADSSSVSQTSAAAVGSLTTVLPKKSSPSAVSEMEPHKQPKIVAWSGTPTSTSSLKLDFSIPSYIDGAALWSVRPALLANSQSSPNKLSQELQLPRWPGAPTSTQKETPTPKKEDSKVLDANNPQVTPSTVSQPEKPWNGCEPKKQWASGLPGVSTSAQSDQSSAMPTSTPVSHSVGSTLWDKQTQPGIPKTTNSSEKLVNQQEFQKQVSSAWASVTGQAGTQKVPISIQYEPHRFGQGIGTPIWGFQNNPVGSQTLLSGQLKPGNGPELQQQPMVTGTQIIINQPSPFLSPPLAPLPPLALPGPHPLHSVAVGALSRPPHANIFFTPQAVMGERSHMPQTLPLPQLSPRTEPHKLGARLPFAPERLLQCMICGCSLPRELDLQMHYLQHAQGEI